MKTAKIILSIVVIFGAGFLSGNFFRAFQGGGEPEKRSQSQGSPKDFWQERQRHFLERLDRGLNLTDEQKLAISQVLDESQQRMEALWDTISPAAKDEFKRVNEEIKGLLDPEQAALFEEMMKRKHHHKNKNKDKKDRDDRERYGKGSGFQGGC